MAVEFLDKEFHVLAAMYLSHNDWGDIYPPSVTASQPPPQLKEG